MKNYLDIKLLLFGIALIAFFPYAWCLMESGEPDFFSSIFIAIGLFSPIIGLIFCIVGLFMKNKENKPNFKNMEELNEYFGIKDSTNSEQHNNNHYDN